MSDGSMPNETASRRNALAAKALAGGLRATLAFSPRPAALVLRSVFKRSAAERGARQLRDAPADIVSFFDERYDPGPDALLDVYLPGRAARDNQALPVIVWTHGGAFVGGSKEEIGGYLRMIADRGFAVVAIRYTLAPEGTYPTPVRQVMVALRHIEGHARRLHVDPTRVVLAGDSAGAQITAQTAAIVTNPEYAEAVGIASSIDPAHLRGVVLCCGIFDLGRVEASGPFRDIVHAVGWAYSGSRDYRSDDYFVSTTSVPRYVTADFPAAFLTVGNDDPLVSQSHAFAASLSDKGVETDTLFYDADHEPRLGHEYQFELDVADGRVAFDRLVAFCERRTHSG
jgi:acetyl esterase